MTTEREAFEDWAEKEHLYIPTDLAWLAWQASRKVAFTDVMVLATVGATYPELMEYMQEELK